MMETSCVSIEVEEPQAVEFVPNNNMEQAIGSIHANNENQTQSVDALAQGPTTSENNKSVTSKGVLRDIQPGRHHHPYPGIRLHN
ncbi:hypothetical protein Aduo_008490 [Ancylostoma duodenale]